MKSLAIIDDHQPLLDRLKQDLSGPEVDVVALNPSQLERRAFSEAVRDFMMRDGERILLIDVKWERFPDSALAFFEAVKSICPDRDDPATGFLMSGFDMEQVGPRPREAAGEGAGQGADRGASSAGDEVSRWNRRLMGFLRIRSLVSKPVETRQVRALLNTLPPGHPLLGMLNSIDVPARLVDADGEPFARNVEWNWALDEPPTLRENGEAGRTQVLQEFIGAMVGAEQQDTDYHLVRISDLEGGRRLEIATPVPSAPSSSASVDDTLKAAALWAARCGFNQLRFYERVLHYRPDAGGEQREHLRLRGHYRVGDPDDQTSIKDVTPRALGDLDRTQFFIDRFTHIEGRSDDDGGHRAPRSFLSMRLPGGESPLLLPDDLHEVPQELLFETRHAAAQIAEVDGGADPDRDERHAFITRWNAAIGVEEEHCWAEIPVLMRADHEAPYRVIGWLILQHADGADALGDDPNEVVRQALERRSPTARNFCAALADQIRRERELRLDRAALRFRAFHARQRPTGDMADLQAYFARLLQQTLGWLNADIGAIARLPHPRAQPVMEAFARRIGDDRIDVCEPRGAPELTPQNYPALFDALRRKQPVSYPSWPSTPADVSPPDDPERPTARMAHPIMIGDRLVGVIALVSFTPWSFDEIRMRLLKSLVEGGHAQIEARLEKMDRLKWEHALVHELSRDTRTIQTDLRYLRRSIANEDARDRIDTALDRLELGLLDLKTFVDASLALLRRKGEKVGAFDAGAIIETLIPPYERRLRDAGRAKFHDERGRIALDPSAGNHLVETSELGFNLVMRVLLSNAVTHGAFSVDARDVQVRLMDHPSEEGMLRVKVFNPGRIDEDALQTLYEPFKGGSRRSASVLNVGLAAAKMICDGAGARLRIENEPDTGRVTARADWPRPKEGEG